jgi:methionyl aminopeptidase
MVNLKTEEELVIIRESAQILGKAHGEIARHVRPGVQTITLDKLAEESLRSKITEVSQPHCVSRQTRS